jgi:hypothetical protein
MQQWVSTWTIGTVQPQLFTPCYILWFQLTVISNMHVSWREYNHKLMDVKSVLIYLLLDNGSNLEEQVALIYMDSLLGLILDHTHTDQLLNLAAQDAKQHVWYIPSLVETVVQSWFYHFLVVYHVHIAWSWKWRVTQHYSLGNLILCVIVVIYLRKTFRTSYHQTARDWPERQSGGNHPPAAFLYTWSLSLYTVLVFTLLVCSSTWKHQLY